MIEYYLANRKSQPQRQRQRQPVCNSWFLLVVVRCAIAYFYIRHDNPGHSSGILSASAYLSTSTSSSSSSDCDISGNPILTFHYNSTTGSYLPLLDLSTNFTSNSKESNITSTTIEILNGTNGNHLIRRRRKLFNINNPYHGDATEANQDEDTLITNDRNESTLLLDRPTIIKVRECTCTNDEYLSKTGQMNWYQYKNRYYCLDQYQYCYVPIKNPYALFYTPNCYNQSEMVSASRGIWKPTIFMFSILVGLLFFTPYGRRAIGGLLSFLVGPCWWDNYLVSYMLENKPHIAHHLIEQRRARLSENDDVVVEPTTFRDEITARINTFLQQFQRRFHVADTTQDIQQSIDERLPELAPNITGRLNNQDNIHVDSEIDYRSRHSQKIQHHPVQYEIRTKRYYPKRHSPTSKNTTECTKGEVPDDTKLTLSWSSHDTPSDNKIQTTNFQTDNETCMVTNSVIIPTNRDYDDTSIRPVDISESNIDNDDNGSSIVLYKSVVCSICLLEILPRAKIGNIPCHHLFHIDCLKLWLRRRNVCPLCLHPNIATPTSQQQQQEQLLNSNHHQQQNQQQQPNNSYHQYSLHDSRYPNSSIVAVRLTTTTTTTPFVTTTATAITRAATPFVPIITTPSVPTIATTQSIIQQEQQQSNEF